MRDPTTFGMSMATTNLNLSASAFTAVLTDTASVYFDKRWEQGKITRVSQQNIFLILSTQYGVVHTLSVLTMVQRTSIWQQYSVFSEESC